MDTLAEYVGSFHFNYFATTQLPLELEQQPYPVPSALCLHSAGVPLPDIYFANASDDEVAGAEGPDIRMAEEDEEEQPVLLSSTAAYGEYAFALGGVRVGDMDTSGEDADDEYEDSDDDSDEPMEECSSEDEGITDNDDGDEEEYRDRREPIIMPMPPSLTPILEESDSDDDGFHRIWRGFKKQDAAAVTVTLTARTSSSSSAATFSAPSYPVFTPPPRADADEKKIVETVCVGSHEIVASATAVVQEDEESGEDIVMDGPIANERADESSCESDECYRPVTPTYERRERNPDEPDSSDEYYRPVSPTFEKDDDDDDTKTVIVEQQPETNPPAAPPQRPFFEGEPDNTLFEQYRRILPPTCFPPFTPPPTPLPDAGLYLNPGHPIHPGIYAFVKEISNGASSGRCDVVMARSMMAQFKGFGMRKGALCAIKMYDRVPRGKDVKVKDIRDAEERLEECDAELGVYRRIASAARRGKAGFLFLGSLDASLQDESRFFLVMELMKMDLRTYIMDDLLPKDEPARSSEVKRLVAQITVGIATLHSIGIIHRDIKPENIMLSFQGNIKIVDFGLSMLSSSTHTPFVPGEKHVPDYGGTFPYMAPETVMSKGWGMEVDWWALGIVVVELESIRVKHCSGFLSKEDYKMWFKCAAQKSVAEKRIFFKEEKLTGDALDLACGLLWPKPANRYGFDTLLHHPYFTTNGVSVFDKLGARSFEREREVYHPAFSGFFPVRRYAPTMVRDIPNSWVNPRGSFYPPGYAHPDYPDY